MKRFVAITLMLAFVAMPVMAQSPAPTGEPDLMRELWFVDDARPIATGQTDLRLTLNWITASAPANGGDSNDDFIITPGLTWGCCDNVEVFAQVPVWVGDGGDKPTLDEGNADTTIGFTWRFMEPADGMPAAAIRTTARVPTGDGSNGIDAEARLILTNEYDSGIRSHLNAFAATINGDNEPTLRDFQWGVVFGLDGPLCGDGAVRWVADYLHRSGFHNGASNIHMLELGWEWDMAEAQKLGMSVQIGLDHVDDTPNFGAGIAYSHSLTR